MTQATSRQVQGFRLSPQQRRLWLLHGGAGEAAQCAVLVAGGLRPAALRDAARTVAAAHEILRTTFQGPPGMRIPFQVVHDDLAPAFREVALPAAPPGEQAERIRSLLDEERASLSDLARGPLVRVTLAGLGAERQALLLTLPALCGDTRTLRNIAVELLAACGLGPPRAGEPLQYADVAEWQNDLGRADADGVQVAAARAYWRRQSQEAGSLPLLPGETPAAAAAPCRPRAVPLDLSAGLPALERCAAAHGASLFEVLLGGWQTLLWRLAGGDQITVGVGFEGRSHTEMADALGLFGRRLPLRVRCDPRQSFGEVLRQAAAAAREAAERQDYADWDEGGRDFRQDVVCAAGFTLEDWPDIPLLAGGSASLLELRLTLEPFRIELGALRRSGELATEIRYDAALLPAAAAAALGRQLVALLASAAADPGRAAGELDLLGSAERHRLLVAFNAGQAPAPRARGVHELFEEQARRDPGATAAVCAADAVTYGELNRRANRLAHHLRARGIGPEDRVALALPRSLDLLGAMLATLKAGAAFVPLDLGYPAPRLAAMVAEAGARLALTRVAAEPWLTAAGISTLSLDDPQIESRSDHDPAPLAAPENLAYVLFTSGSSGRPKGVAVEHRQLLHYLGGILQRLDLPARASFATVSTLAADLGNTAIYPALSTGGTLHLITQDTASDPAAFAAYCRRHPIDCLKIVPSHLAALLARERPAELLPRRVLVLGGEALGWELVRRVRQASADLALFNHYGPTETTVGVLCGAVGDAAAPAPETATAPLGLPLPGSRVYLLDARGEPVPAGVPGELHVGGAGLSRGYLGRPEATAETFIPDSFSGESGARLYRTGDLVRRHASEVAAGGLEFLGRVDQQIKLRGFRIELGEIESVLESHPGIERAVVTVHERPPGTRRLAAYLVTGPRRDLTATALRRFVRERLPEPMHPSAYRFLSALPLTANGKVDRRALPELEEDAAVAPARFVAPRTPGESALAHIWCEVLGLDRVGVHENFFELGGDSILCIQILARAGEAGLGLTLHQVFQHQTIAGLAAQAGAPPTPPPAAAAGTARSEAAAALEDVYPASPMQRAMLFLAELDPEAGVYLDQAVYTLRGELDADAFRRAWQAVVARHPALRTRFLRQGSEPALQAVEREAELPWQEADWRQPGGAGRRQRLADWLAADRRRGFDLSRAPLLRLALVRTAEAEHLVIWTFHHIVLDGWSVARVLSEVSALYVAFTQGGEARLAPSRPYGDFIRWLVAQDAAAGRALWTRALAGFTAPTPLPFRSGAPPAGESPHLEAAARLGDAPTHRLLSLARQHHLTLNTLVQGAWAVLLHHYSGEPDVVFGATVAGRPPELPGVESMVGLFINTLPVRARLDPAAPLLAFLRTLQDEQAELRLHQQTPLHDIQGWSAVLRGLPLFESLVVFDNFPVDEVIGALGERLAVDADFHFFNRTNFALTLASWPARELPLALRYDSGRFEHTAIQRLLAHLLVLLEGIAAAPEARLAALPMLSRAERQQMLAEWNDTATVRGRSVLAMIEAQAAAQPQAPAVVFGRETWSYREVMEEAGCLARQLRAVGVGPGDLVAVHLHRRAEMVPALLGILASGAAYLPIEVTLPPARVSWLLSHLGIRCAVTEGRRVEALAELALPELAHLLLVDEHQPAEHGRLRLWGRHTRPRPPLAPPLPLSSPGPRDLAYIVFTSGSTGTPKGVAVQHGPVENLIAWVNERFQMSREDRVLFVTSLSFDLSVYDVFGLLAAGGSVHVASEEELGDPAALVRILDEEPITFWDSAPAALQQVVPCFRPARVESRLRLVFLSGDWVPLGLPDQVRGRFPLAQVVALGGATEATVWSNFFPVTEVEPGWVSIPYGRPIGNARYHVLDEDLGPRPIGAAGDLYIGGDCLALGYVGEPGLTAWKFVPDGCGGGPGARLYRTGDQARYWQDGVLEFLGRRDQQVKIRGFRIELGEVEAALAEHAAVREAVVLAHGEPRGDRRLVAYVVAAGPVTAAELRGHLRERLPEPMVPAAFSFLAAMPVTANGKLDRKALAPPEPGPAGEAEEPAAPGSAVEQLLVEIWAEVLGHHRVGIHDNYFELGGHSLIATHLLARVREALGVELPLRRLFDAPTVAGLASAVEQALQGGAGDPPPPLVRIPRHGELPLSFAQERLWFLDQLEPGGRAYNLHAALDLDGPLDFAALAAALCEVVRRHEVLRTTFRSAAGRPLAVVHEPRRCALPLVDLRRLDAPAGRGAEVGRRSREEARRAFDLAAGPLLRVRLLRLAEQEHVALITMHHIASDGESVQVLIREVVELYRAGAAGLSSPLPELPVQYLDYAAWQRSWLTGAVVERQLAYWREQLAKVPARLDLPADRARPPLVSLQGAARSLEVPAAVAAAVGAWSRSQGVTLMMTLLAVFEALLSRYSGQPVIAVGAPISGRQHRQTEGLIGFFVNTLVLRGDLLGAPSLRQLVGRVREAALGAHAHRDLPFERLVQELRPERSLGQTPLFQVMFAFENAARDPRMPPGLALRMRPAEAAVAKFDLTLSLVAAGTRLEGALRYRTDLFDPATIARLGAHWLRLLERALAAPDLPLAELPLLGAAERQQLAVEWSGGSPAPAAAGALCVHQLFARQAAATPGAAAIECEGRQVSYGELDRQANRLAHRLRRLGVGPETLAGILLEPSLEMVVALLAIHKAGGGYLGLDLGLPAERLAFLLADAGVRVVVTREELAGRLAGLGVAAVRIDARDEDLERESVESPEAGATPEHLAYVIYTSGSTGQPKGVAGQHSQLLSYLHGILGVLDLPPGASFGLQQSLAVDAPITYLFAALCGGGVLHLITPQRLAEPEALADLFARRPVDCLKIAPSHLGALMASGHGRQILPRRLLLVGGESSTWDQVRAVREAAPACIYLNHYGPTETTVGVLVHRADEIPAAPASQVVPLGRPLAGARVHVLDARGEPLPIGIAGDLHIGGRGLARGYLGRPELTADRFVPDPSSGGEPGERLYRTGDLARVRRDGVVEFLGRIDHQVKVRGFRVELGEIEVALGRHPSIAAAVVAATRDNAEGIRLIAYLVPIEAPAPSATELRRFLAATLPEPMLPSSFVVLERLPRTPQGKVDRQALPAPDRLRPELEESFVAPRNEREERLAALWQEVLGVASVGVRDNFFDLGGHSLLATRVIARVRQAFAVDVPLRALFEAPTVAGLAGEIERMIAGGAAAVPGITPVARESRRLQRTRWQ
jgi:amino acid adenylation domain-containing protein